MRISDWSSDVCSSDLRLFREDFCRASLDMQGLFIHEMTHVAQSQWGGRYYLPLIRHPFCRYDYTITPGQAFGHYGIERSEESRVGKESVVTGRSRWSRYH